MENFLGLLRIHVQRGVNLAIRDIVSSDPYVVITMGERAVIFKNNIALVPLTDLQQNKLKTRVIRSNINPEWNEDLTLSVTDPKLPIKIVVYDKDTFSPDDKMGDAEIDITPFLEALKMGLKELPNGTTITRIQPTRQNCLAEESCIIWTDSKVVQNMCLRLKNVECGELELQLQWVDVPGCRGL